jgi:hypothetical protein
VRAAINKENKVPGATVKKDAKAVPTLLADGEELKLDPLGTDRDKARIWSIDSKSCNQGVVGQYLMEIRLNTNIPIWKPI